MTVESTCPKCGRKVPVEFDSTGFDDALAEAMKRFASHTLCPACSPPPPPKPTHRQPEDREVRYPMADP
jgi:hypothetical protein